MWFFLLLNECVIFAFLFSLSLINASIQFWLSIIYIVCHTCLHNLKMSQKVKSNKGAGSVSVSDSEHSPVRSVRRLPDSDDKCRVCSRQPATDADILLRCSKCNCPYHNRCKDKGELIEDSCRRCYIARIISSDDTTPRPASPALSYTSDNPVSNEDLRSLLLTIKAELSSEFTALRTSVDTRITAIEDTVAVVQEDTRVLKIDVSTVQGEIVNLKRSFEASLVEVKNEVASHCFKEMAERTSKQRNVMIFGVPEPSSSLTSSRNKADDALIRDILSLLSPTFSSLRFQFFRVGKVMPAAGGNPRPLRVILPSPADAFTIRKLFVEQKTSDSVPDFITHIVVSQDRTPLQRQEFKALKIQMDNRTKQGEKDLYIGERNGLPTILQRRVKERERANLMTTSQARLLNLTPK